MRKGATTITLLALTAGVANAEQVKTFDQAVEKVIKSVKKNKLLNLPIECVSFYESEEAKTTFYIDVREKHNKKCGGDPETAPRLFSYQVNKRNGKLCTDSMEWANRLNARDPTDFLFQCIPIK